MTKLYVVIRGDLSRSQQAVQAGHAIAEYLMTKRTSWSNGAMVFLKVKDLTELQSLFEKTEEAVCFREPDIGHQMTAFAIEGNDLYPDLSLL